MLAMPEGITQNMGIHGSITGKTMTRIIYFDHLTTVPTPLPKLYPMKRMRSNYEGITYI